MHQPLMTSGPLSRAATDLMAEVHLTVDGAPVVVDIDQSSSLLRALRDAGFTGTKGACEQGECGSCSVLLEGALVCSCLVPAAVCGGSSVVTIASFGLSDLADAMARNGAVQCGFCTPGFVVAAEALLARGATSPSGLTEQTIREGLAGNLCRCTGYDGLVRAVLETSTNREK